MAESHSKAAKKRLSHMTKEQRSKHMANIVKKGRWAKMTDAEKTAHAQKMLAGRYKKISC